MIGFHLLVLCRGCRIVRAVEVPNRHFVTVTYVKPCE